MNKGTADPVRN